MPRDAGQIESGTQVERGWRHYYSKLLEPQTSNSTRLLAKLHSISEEVGG